MKSRNRLRKVERPEMFRALRTRPELQDMIPAYRAFYGKPARIFLVRGGGELMMTMAVPRSRVGEEEECMENDGDDDDGDDTPLLLITATTPNASV